MEGNRVSTFRERFNELVESSSKSRTAIADEFHVAKQTISAWATGQTSPRLPVASALADYFDVNLGWLLGYDVPKHVNKEDLAKNDAVQDYIDYDPKLSNTEHQIIIAYRKASPDTKAAVCNVLGIKEEKKDSSADQTA